MSSKVVPFGKYKGQPVEAMVADRDYCEWLAGQDWFRSRYAEIHTVIINYGGEPQDTPEHNRLQAMFLDPEFCRRVLRWADPEFGIETRDDANEWLASEAKQYAYVAAGKWKEWEMTPAVFESGGWDVTYSVEHGAHCYYGPSQWSSETKKWGGYRDVYVEIKPSLGDDFPAVMRQIRAHKQPVSSHPRCILLIGDFCAEGATLSQVFEMFSRSGIRIVSLSDVYS
jgi:hypothetical protein